MEPNFNGENIWLKNKLCTKFSRLFFSSHCSHTLVIRCDLQNGTCNVLWPAKWYLSLKTGTDTLCGMIVTQP